MEGSPDTYVKSPSEGAPGQDVVGKIETRGIDYIPEAERHSSPWNMFWILVGGEMTFGVIVTGWLPIAFGLGWWSAVSSITVGLAVGSAVLASMPLLGPQTGTNGAVSSGAHFGVRGRLLGSAIALFIALGFTALTIWTGGQAAVAGGHELFGWPNSDGAFAVSYAIIAAVTITAAIFGHASIVTLQKVMIPSAGLLLAIGFFTFLPDFNASYAGGNYLLAGFWPTWALSFTVAASLPISYGPFVNDWSRYISAKRWSRKSVMLGTGVGAFVGLWIALVFAAYTATMFSDVATPYVEGLIGISPTWYIAPIMVIGIVGSFGQGALGLNGTGLDFSSLFPRLTRVPATLLLSAIAVTFVYVGTFVWNAIDTVSAFVLILVVLTTPFCIICIIGYWWRGCYYLPDDLQVFNRRERGGAYWFTGGVNVRAVAAWLPAVIVGLLFLNTTLYVGPWANAVGGIDMSWMSAGVISGIVYYALLRLLPEPDFVFAPRVRRRGREGVSLPMVIPPQTAMRDTRDDQ